MTTIRISKEVLSAWPQTQVGVLLAEVRVNQSKKGPCKNYLSALKQEVVKGLIGKEITVENYQSQKVCQSWKKVFSTFGVGEDKVSTIENLLRRAATEADKVKSGQAKNANLGSISDPVDLYNCVSIETLTPMGALAKDAIQGDIELRLGKEGETFTTLGKQEETYDVTPQQIIYADDKSVLTWLWNYRDARHACIPAKTSDRVQILFFADQAEEGAGDVQAAIRQLAEKIGEIGGNVISQFYLDAETPSVVIEQPALV